VGRWSGSCHCGAVRFEVEAEPTELTHCDCSLCKRKNALMFAVHESGLTVLAGEDKLALYQWNTGVAQHRFCSVCGVYTFHRKRSAPDHYGINVNCLEGFDPSAYPVRAAQGVSMTVTDPDARPEWRGPRQA
jgi:hypothetical protein